MYTQTTYTSAVAYIRGGPEMPNLRGTARFCQKQEYVLVTVNISGLPQDNPSGFFALHIHEGTGCGGTDFSDTGSHFNPAEEAHPRHAGDLPPLLMCNEGAYLAVHTDRFQLRDIIGRTVVIHSHFDDFVSQPSGNSGTKIACGVIRPLA